MTETWCGKQCSECSKKEELNCPGCQAGPGRSWSGDCEIAVCCRDKGHESCGTCTNSRFCGKHSRKDDMPERRLRKLAAEAEKRAEFARKAPFLWKWLSILFWMVIPSTVASLLGMDAMADVAPEVYRVGNYLTVVCALLYGLILLRLSKENLGYHTAGILRLVTAVASLLLVLVSRDNAVANWSLLISLPAAVVGLVGTYQEYMAHAAVLSGVDDEQAGKWQVLWKWRIGLYLGAVGGMVIMLIVALLGILAVFAALIGILVVAIVELVYLYRTAQAFRTN